MKVFLAGNSGMKSREILWLKIARRRLLSFHYIVKKEFSVDESFELIKEKNK